MVWIASYPKSGNTWMRMLLSDLFCTRGTPATINALFELIPLAASRLAFEDAWLVDSFLLSGQEIQSMRPALHDDQAKTAVFLKTHDAFVRLLDGRPMHGCVARKAIYLVRDPRDVAISYAHHSGVSVDEMVDLMNETDSNAPRNRYQLPQAIGRWDDHVRSWLEQSDISLHVVRYEDMVADTMNELRNVVDFLGEHCSEAELARAIDNAAFARLRKQEEVHGFREAADGQQHFFRSGRAGGWRSELSADQVARIHASYSETMARLGYGSS